MFDPKTKKYPYTEYTDEHYLKVKKDNGLVFDESYPYIDNSFGMRFKHFWVRVLLYIVVWPVAFFKLGLRIKGRSNLKAYKEQLKRGVVSVSNHIHLWDYIAIMKAIRPKDPRVIVWAPNIRGENGTLMRLVGGVPIPDNHRGFHAFNVAIDKYLDEGGWLQIYAEGSMWEYYAPIRPFKTGAASYAVKHNIPMVPLAFSYRKPSWLRKKLFNQAAVITLNVGKPIFKDDSLPPGEQVKDLTIRAHQAVVALAGFKSNENIYPPIFDHNKRVDYY